MELAVWACMDNFYLWGSERSFITLVDLIQSSSWITTNSCCTKTLAEYIYSSESVWVSTSFYNPSTDTSYAYKFEGLFSKEVLYSPERSLNLILSKIYSHESIWVWILCINFPDTIGYACRSEGLFRTEFMDNPETPNIVFEYFLIPFLEGLKRNKIKQEAQVLTDFP